MGPRPCSQAPPVSTDQLLELLRRRRLLDDEALRRLAVAWNPEHSPAPHLEELVQAGLLTRYQADQLATGKFNRLRLGPYRLLDRLGAGGMGQVYKAEHLLLRRVVALKLLGKVRPQRPTPSGVETPSADRLQTPPHLRRKISLRREIEAAGRLTHPHIISAHDACRIRGRLVLVLEYVDGIDLDRLVRGSGPLTPALAREVVRQSALALQHLHERGMVHRDVKPANLILTHASDGAPHVKLLDLGLVCRAADAGEELCGTPDYLAPERGLSPGCTDVRSDLYSLGCTLYFLLTGRVPFPGGNWTGKLLRHQIEVATPVADLRADVPPPLLAILDRLMARDPAARFATPALLVDALAEPRPEALTLAPTPSLPPPRWTFAMLSRLLMTTVLVGASAGSLARLVVTPKPDPAAVPTTRVSNSLGAPIPEPPAPPFDLPAALAKAADGAVIVVPSGRYSLPDIALRGKAVTLRAAVGARPVLARSAPNGWDAILHSDRDLTLEGLELQGGGRDGPAGPLVLVERGKLTLRDCTLRQLAPAPCLSLRHGSHLTLERCRLHALTQGVAVEGHASVTLRETDCRVLDVTGAAVLLWSREHASLAPIHVTLTGATIQAGRILACRSVAGPVRVQATNNRFAFRQGLVSFDGYGDGWRNALTWQARQNRYEPAGPWLRVEGRPGPADNEGAFERLWAGRE